LSGAKIQQNMANNLLFTFNYFQLFPLVISKKSSKIKDG